MAIIINTIYGSFTLLCFRFLCCFDVYKSRIAQIQTVKSFSGQIYRRVLLRPFIHHVVCTKIVLNPYDSCSVHEMYHDLSDDLSMLVFCFRGHTFVDNFIYELQKSATIAFLRNSLYTFYPRNPTCGIHQCLRISNHKHPPMPSEFHNREPPLPFGNPKSRLWYGMDIFWNRPFCELASIAFLQCVVTLTGHRLCLNLSKDSCPLLDSSTWLCKDCKVCYLCKAVESEVRSCIFNYSIHIHVGERLFNK